MGSFVIPEDERWGNLGRAVLFPRAFARRARYAPLVANARRSFAENAEGDFFVDSSCIDCETCRWVAPASFGSARDHAFVERQPRTPAEEHRALLALLACPTGSIGTRSKHNVKAAQSGFPDPAAEDVFHLGYHAESSFGAASYLLRSSIGNVMVDSPRFVAPLVRSLEDSGGVELIFLTHQDDLADFEKYRDHFGARVVIHEDDLGPRTKDAQLVISGLEPAELAPELLAIPVPGHTAGSMCLLFRQRVLLSGDHLAYNPKKQHLVAFRSACWFDWGEQIRSMERLLAFRFEQVLPGHGHPAHLTARQMHAELEACIRWMKARA